MAIRFGGSLFMPVLAVAGVALVGVGGYRMISGGCSDGACGDKIVAVDNAHEGCALCPSDKVVEASLATGGECTLNASCESKAACETKSECTEGKSECEGKVCPMTGQTATPVALETEAKECKEGKDGCTGDGKNGCCGNCAAGNTAACCKKTEGGQG